MEIKLIVRTTTKQRKPLCQKKVFNYLLIL